MRTYHPKSWSEQARRRANFLFECVMYMMYRNIAFGFYDNMGEYHDDVTPEQYVVYQLSNSYRAEIIRYRAAKRFGRMWRKYLAK